MFSCPIDTTLRKENKKKKKKRLREAQEETSASAAPTACRLPTARPLLLNCRQQLMFSCPIDTTLRKENKKKKKKRLREAQEETSAAAAACLSPADGEAASSDGDLRKKKRMREAQEETSPAAAADCLPPADDQNLTADDCLLPAAYEATLEAGDEYMTYARRAPLPATERRRSASPSDDDWVPEDEEEVATGRSRLTGHIADQAVAEARRMRQAHLRRTLAPEPRRARYVCPVGRGTANPCGAQVQVLTRHLATHFLRDSEEFQAALQASRVRADPEAHPALGLAWLTNQFALFLGSLRGGACGPDKVRRHIRAVEMLVPVILPDLPSQSVTPQRVLLALSSEKLACEGRDGWMTAQLEQQQRTASSLKEDVRRFRRFVGWIDISLERFGLEHERPRMTSDYVNNVLGRTPEADVVYKEAKESRDVLMTTLLVWCAGRPSHVTGITVDNLREAKLTTIEETAMRLIRNTHFKTAATCTLDVAVPQEIWRRLLMFAERERPTLCPGLQEASDKLFVSRAGTHIDTSNANKIFKTVWSAAFGVHGSNFTARGGRFGAVMAVAERNPEDQEGVAAAMGHVGTALRFYDVHGVSGKNKRLTGVAALLRFRKNKLALDPVMPDGETPSTATAAVPPSVAAVPPSTATAATVSHVFRSLRPEADSQPTAWDWKDFATLQQSAV
ncbi:hypothetical protein FJT64_003438 [Amphibalanus amphitrite]|uniref:Tyr recombinase domain-containing protein n=1 Tax=Amphibalanus amphitrite TaxID=1232801 RepID=A0A6A4WCG6_AMPAM|nr:hypothetical protein FJT64_003438 [Amphibalanus amphitrite]